MNFDVMIVSTDDTKPQLVNGFAWWMMRL